jgi:hypothetical protein
MAGTFKVKFYSDPGHGWGAVKRRVLFDLGIADKISTYSYQKGNTVYLEEDCDLGVLIGALKAAGVSVQLEEKSTNSRSPIRSYDYFIA